MPLNERLTNEKSDRRIDYPLCRDLLHILLAKDGWTLRNVSRAQAFAPNAVFLAHKGGRWIAFFLSDQPTCKLTTGFKRIQQRDHGRFKVIGVLIAPTTMEMKRLRGVDLADKFPRAFFASMEEMGELVAGSTPALPERSGGIASFEAKILTNTRIGGPQSLVYRLVFNAPEMQEIRPPQFFMMDAIPMRAPFGSHVVRRGNLRGAVDLGPRPFLKRPFGICRYIHPHFPIDYVRRLSLPPSLALVLHPTSADHFDMLYKVLPGGAGTPLMTKLKRGQKIEMIGPLGRPFDARRLHAEGAREVHVIGGGVGMAPLIPLVEALRYYAFPVKVFLGIAKLKAIRYRDEFTPTLRSGDAYTYIDDMLAAGMKASDIYVSCDSEVPTRVVRGIPKKNLFHGLVPEQYRRFLKNHAAARGGNVRAFTCGPNPMMELVVEIAQQAGIRLHVLVEKRMACGIGVCFSCVQKVRRPNGTEDYARTCTEGTLFDAKDILWKNDDSKQTSANSCCAALC
ncbi:MAG: hypothetical protein ABSC38_00985 [Verrucomicrobiia bacterium]